MPQSIRAVSTTSRSGGDDSSRAYTRWARHEAGSTPPTTLHSGNMGEAEAEEEGGEKGEEEEGPVAAAGGERLLMDGDCRTDGGTEGWTNRRRLLPWRMAAGRP